MLIIGHRGAGGYEPENTMLSFQKAIDLNADMIEMDVHKCRTGELVIIHDLTVDRTTNGSGYIWDLSLHDLQKLDAGKGQKIPTLEQVLDNFTDVKINLELKGEDTVEPVYELLVKYISPGKYKENIFFISSFNHYLLLEFKKIMPQDFGTRICPLVEGIPLGYAEFAEKLNAYSVNISGDFVSEIFVNDAHSRGIKVFVYTVNDLNEFNRMASMGVDGIFTDFPDLFK